MDQRVAVRVGERLRHRQIELASDLRQSPVRQLPHRHRGPVDAVGRAVAPPGHDRSRRIEDRRRVGGTVQRRHAGPVLDAQRVAEVAMPRVREAQQRRATDVDQPTMTVVGHDRRPPAGRRRARLEHPLVHVPVGRARKRAALVRLGMETVVEHSHVVPELVREGVAAADVVGDAERLADVGDAAQAAVVADDQVYEVRPDPVAYGVHLVQVAV